MWMAMAAMVAIVLAGVGAADDVYRSWGFEDLRGNGWELRMVPVAAGGHGLCLLEAVFDFERYAQTERVYACWTSDCKHVYRSDDVGRSWSPEVVLGWAVTDLFTASTGTHLAWDRDGGRWRRLGREWDELPCDLQVSNRNPMTQGIGEHGGVVMVAEYAATSSAAARVWRSTDDMATWAPVLSLPVTHAGDSGLESVRHFHAVQPDPWRPGAWYAFSGDTGRECRVYWSGDDGVSWSEVTDLQPGGIDQALSVHRMTCVQFWADGLGWLTDDPLGGRGSAFVRAGRGADLYVNAVCRADASLGRWLVRTDAGLVCYPEARADGVHLGLVEDRARYREVGVVEDGVGGFTYARGSRQAIEGRWVTTVGVSTEKARWNYMAGWELDLVRPVIEETPVEGVAGTVGTVGGIGIVGVLGLGKWWVWRWIGGRMRKRKDIFTTEAQSTQRRARKNGVMK